MKTLIASLSIVLLGGPAWWLMQPERPQEGVRPPPALAYGVGRILEIDRELGRVTLRHRPLSAPHSDPVAVSYFIQEKRQLAGLHAMESVEFQVLHDGNDDVVTDIRSRGDGENQAGVPGVCASVLKHSGRASLSQTASARSAAPPSAT